MQEPNVTCQICHKAFHVPPSEVASRKTCGLDCERQWRSQTNTQHREPNFTCPVCGKRVWFPPSRLKWARTCGASCYGPSKKGIRRTNTGITCINCGTWRYVRPSIIKERNPRFCSSKCMGEYRHKNGIFAKENHPNWKGGKDWERMINHFRASTPFKRWAENVRDQANGTCEDCGDQGSEAHHIYPVEEILEFLLDPRNGRYLCDECHKKPHAANGSTFKLALRF